MKAFLFDKLSAQNAWIVCASKLRTLLMQVTGYDLMFEESRRDIKPLLLNKSNKNVASLNNRPVMTFAARVLRSMELSFEGQGERREKKIAPAGHSSTSYLNHEP
jgi:hypothetical protein